MGDEEQTWQSRRDQVRQAYKDRLQAALPLTEDVTPTPPETTGSAPSPAAPLEGHFALNAAAGLRSSGMSATDTARVFGTPASHPASSTPAGSTNSSFAGSTVWTVSPLGWLDTNTTASIVDPSGKLLPGLAPNVQSSLQALATGRAEPLEAVVKQIAEFFVENEDERAEGPLGEAVTFYVENYLGSLV